jgi:hypothetical protein
VPTIAILAPDTNPVTVALAEPLVTVMLPDATPPHIPVGNPVPVTVADPLVIVITGTCLRSGNPAPDTGATYSERAGYRPQGAWGQVVRLRPGEEDVRRRIRVSTLDV